MSGRASRARLLAPSFLVVATALACGGKSVDQVGNPDERGGGGSSAGTGTFNPPPPECPSAAPSNGSACVGGLTCSYSSNDFNPCIQAPSTTTTASCARGAWQVSYSTSSCNPPMPRMCPPTMPTPGTSCAAGSIPGEVCIFYSPYCGQESATCLQGVWSVSRCEILVGSGGEGGQPQGFAGAPDAAAGSPGEAGAAQGGVGGL